MKFIRSSRIVVAVMVFAVVIVTGCGDGSSRTRQSNSDEQNVLDEYNKMHEAGRKAGYNDQQIDDIARKAIEANRNRR